MAIDQNNPFADLPDTQNDPFADLPDAQQGESGILPALGAGVDQLQELGYRAVKGFTDVGVPQEEQTNAIGRAIGQGGSLSQWADEGIRRNQQEQQAYSPTVESYKDIDSIGDAASYVGEMTAQSIPMMGAALNPAGLFVMGGGMSNEAYEAQPEDNKQPWRAAASGFGQAGLERLGVETSIGRLLGGQGQNVVRRVGQSALGEGATETGQEALAQWGAGKSVDEFENLDEAFVGGFAVGGAIRGGTEAGQAAYNKYRGEKPALNELEETDLTQSAVSENTDIPDPFADIGPAQDQPTTANQVEIIPGETAGDTQPNWQFGQNDMPYRGQVTPYTYTGEYEQYREPPRSVPVGQVLEAPIIDGEFERPRGLPDRSDVIIGEDGRPMQQAQEFADGVADASNRALPFRDIIYGEDNRNVQVKRNGKPFGGRKAAQITKEFRQAKEQGLNPQVIKVNGGYGWVADGEQQAPTPEVTPQNVQPTITTKSAQKREAPKKSTRSKVYTPNGRELEVEYAIVDADQLVTSNTDDGRVNPDYPQTLQPRDRTRASSEIQINSIANNLNPALLGESATTGDGAPIISDSGIVESGNGRSLALKRAYQNGKADKYRSALIEQGYDLSGVEKPVLARVRRTQLNDEDLVNYTKESNERSTLSLSASETAKADGNAISNIISDFKGGDVSAAGNRDFVRKFMQGAVSQSEQASMIDSQGMLSQDGRRRIEAAMIANAYENTELVNDLFESSDNDIKSIGGALLDASGDWAKMRAAKNAGATQEDVDITPNVIDAVNLVRRSRAEGKKLSEMVSQTDIFAGDIDPTTKVVLGLFYGGDNFTKPRSRQRVKEALTRYAELASSTNGGDDLFGGELETVKPEQLLGQANAINEQTDQQAEAQTDILDQNPEPAGQSSAGDRGEGQRPTASENGQAGTGSQVSNVSPINPEKQNSEDGFITDEMQRKQNETFRKGLLSRIKYLKNDTALDKVVQDAKQDKTTSVDFIREVESAANARKIELAANEAATSPTNNLPEPTEAQKEAGNYKKGKVRLHGLDISIENPKGSTRKGKDQDGKEWSSEMKHHYGDIKGTTGADGDSIDVFIGDNQESQKVFIVDQIDPKTGEFDEVKVMMGFDDANSAKSGYLSNYDKNWKGLGEITEASVEDFKAWTKRPRKSKQPFAQDLKVKNAEASIAKKGEEASKAQLTDEPKILSITESAWVKSEIKRLALKKGSPGYDAAVSKVKDSYDANYDEAIATVSFERYKELNHDTPESILRKSYDSIKNTAVENGDASFRAADNGNVSTASNSGSVSRADADKVIGDIIRSWSGGVKARRNEFFVASTFNELPNDIKEAAKKQGAEGKVYGVFHNGKTYVVLDKHRSTKEVETTIFHETYGHHGMRKLFGADINRKMNNLYTAIGGMSGLRKAAKNHGVNLDIYIRGADKAKIPQELRNRVLMEELLAHIQQDNRPSVKRLAKELIGAIRQKLRDIGFAELSNVSDSDLFHILKQSRDAVKKGATQTGDARFMFDDKSASVDSEMSSEPISFRVGEEGSPSENKLMESAKQKLGLKENEAKSIVKKVKEAWKDVNYTEAKNRVKEGLFDSLYGIKKAEDTQNVSIEESGYVSARLAQGVGDVIHATMFYGSPEWRDGIVQKKEGTKGLLDIFSQLDSSELNDWLAWMGGNRANVLMKQGRENNLNKSEIEELQSLNSGREELFNKVKEEYNAANAAVLKLAIESGLLDSDVMNKFESEWYVPFFRAEDPTDINEVIKGPTSPNGIANASAQIKTLKGGEQSTKDILQNILQRQATLIDASMKNKAMLEVAGNLDGTPFMTKVKLNKIQIDAITKKRLAKKATPYVSVNDNGETQWYEVLEPSLLRALMQLNVKRSDNPLLKLSRAAKRYLTTGVTLSPTFIIRNYLRDGVHGWMINKDKFVFGLDSVRGAVKTWNKDQSTIDLMFAGASFQGGYVHANDPEQGAQQIRRALRKKGLNESAISKYMASIPKGSGQFFEKYRDFSDSMENANRVSTYDASLKASKSKKQSAFEARDFMDFGLQGNFSAMQFLTDVIPFLNARMQGLYKLYRAGKAGEGESIAKVLSKELAIKGMYVASFSLGLAMYNMEDERYEELPDWDKDANWHFFNGETHIRIPKPFELGVLFGTIPERLFMRSVGKQNNNDLQKSLTHAVTSTLAMNPFPQIIKPGFEVWANYDFFSGRPIDSFSDQFKRPQDRYSMYTTESAKLLGEAFGVSPQRLEHLVRGYAGTLGSYVLTSADVVGNSFATVLGSGEFKINEFDDFSLVRAFVKQGEVGGTYYGEQFYDTLQEINSLHKQYVNANQEQDEEAAEEILKEGLGKLQFRSMFNKAQAHLNKLNHQKNIIWKDKSIPLKERERIIDEISLEKNAVYRAVILEYRKAS
jgi:hypothetical protein